MCLPDMQTSSPSFFQRYQFWLLLLAAFFIHQIPFISIPFKWLESYFHEISHGLAALVSGGTILQIQLFPNGAGLCTTQGGSRFLISFMGYFGATIWGTSLYLLAKSHQKAARVFSFMLIILLALTLIFWVRDLLTFFIISVLIGLFVLKVRLDNSIWLSRAFQLTGLLVLLNSIYSPFYLLDGRSLGDGASLSSLTGLPEFIWVFIWVGVAISSLYYLGRKS